MANPGPGSTIAGCRTRRAVVLAVLCLLVHPLIARSQTATTDEVKAGFLVNFFKFIEWPPAQGGDGPLQIGVLGNDNVSDSLREFIRGKTINGRSLASRRVAAGDDLSHLHMLFIGGAEQARIADVMKRVEGSSVLTVSDVDRFCQQGGMIAFTLEHHHVRFEINLDAADRSGLKVSSKLLTLARTVHQAKAAGDR
jgi:hypothetical protein